MLRQGIKHLQSVPRDRARSDAPSPFVEPDRRTTVARRRQRPASGQYGATLRVPLSNSAATGDQ